MHRVPPTAIHDRNGTWTTLRRLPRFSLPVRPAVGPARAWGEKEEPPGSPRGLDRGEPYRVERRRATLPHPLGCSTIAVQGLSFRVRNGTGRLTLAMAAANLVDLPRKDPGGIGP